MSSKPRKYGSTCPREFNQDFQEKWLVVVKTYGQQFALIMIPIYALITWGLFRKKGMNYAEHLVGNAYLSAQTTLISVVITPWLFLFSWKYAISTAVGVMLTIAYYTISFRSLFHQRWIPAFFKSLLTILFGYPGYSIVIGIIGMIFSIFLAMSNKM